MHWLSQQMSLTRVLVPTSEDSGRGRAQEQRGPQHQPVVRRGAHRYPGSVFVHQSLRGAEERDGVSLGVSGGGQRLGQQPRGPLPSQHTGRSLQARERELQPIDKASWAAAGPTCHCPGLSGLAPPLWGLGGRGLGSLHSGKAVQERVPPHLAGQAFINMAVA